MYNADSHKYSVQFERFNKDPVKLLCNALKLSHEFCCNFPITTETGYISYRNTPTKNALPEQEFWFAVVEAKKKEEAYAKAVNNLLTAELEKPFPVHLQFVDDDIYKL